MFKSFSLLSFVFAATALAQQTVLTCNAQGSTLTDPNVRSGCDGGSAFTCTSNSPWAVNDDLAYGFAAVSLSGSSESKWCCGCYELTFTSGPVAGKKMVVQATNTGGDLGSNHFDILMPGGGVGIFNGCPAQFGSWNGGAQYGGVSSRSECSNLPAGTSYDNPSHDFETDLECQHLQPFKLVAIGASIGSRAPTTQASRSVKFNVLLRSQTSLDARVMMVAASQLSHSSSSTPSTRTSSSSPLSTPSKSASSSSSSSTSVSSTTRGSDSGATGQCGGGIRSSSSASPPAATPGGSSGGAPQWGQCGGIG
ncbi:hypothetical protein EYR40_003412 [Pleurotus pulmonarius]|nr:hypothetical protein EYR40_003412 [Pleurotus pulmonarius]